MSKKSTKHCCSVLFVVRLHSYPDGAPLVAITGQGVHGRI